MSRTSSAGASAPRTGGPTRTTCSPIYHDALRAGGVTDYSLDQLRRDTRREAFGGILMAIVASMVVQRTDRGDLMFLTSTTRHAQHVIDAGSDEHTGGWR